MDVRTELILLAEDFPVSVVYNEIGLLTGEINVNEAAEFKTISEKSFVRPKECSITYSTDLLDTIHVSDSLERICDIIVPKQQMIKRAIEKYRLCAKFYITINISDEPEIILPLRFIQLAAYLNATVEFDTYLNIDKTIEFDEQTDVI